MVNAVVLAGGKEKSSILDFARWGLIQIPYFIAYQKIKIPAPYKCFMNVGGEIDGVYKKRPTIEYILHSLDKSAFVDNVAVVTNSQKLEEKLDVNIKNYMDKCLIVEQGGSIIENALKGYSALNEGKHTLFITGDSPQTTKEAVDEFMEKCLPYMESHDFLFPIVGKRVHHKYDKVFRRKYFWIVDDVTGNEDPFIRKGQRGFRIMSMALVNPERIAKKEAIDFLYDIRNIAAPNNLVKAYKTFKEEIWKIARGNLKLSDLEGKLSSLLETRFKFIEVDDARPSFDLDDIGDEIRIEQINGYNFSINGYKPGIKEDNLSINS